ncbi:1-deoxy-D-xylulose-5-phosphate synthase [Butyrivibrio fibrisolvens]|jgi:1-deoxy-D-xylulose-5-phosphate synthase|uniref:1-deoxy-D-xylulose-5-phosphate synthase n=1 Tax=Butyrivibrio fibrisolvens TaxID=831 RepID=A0A1H9W879_BUTFI|nr:1-deoxy-D-xylulose-5-phosphate synthase [Butyrivibrio fibrisolvens]SES30166.1 1-deoxy-D-xylulose-5-phosphate synthase [Butyrivibrio fibrisolvens]
MDKIILDKINKTGDVKNIPENELPMLSQEIRDFLVQKLSVTGGHLASNLGTVELTIALHRSLNLPEDKIVWDVGHQCYTHKILTGRKNDFDNLRKFGGISGFPKKSESDTDCFDTGHSSNSISAGLGMVKARDLRGEDYTVVSVIGDGALTGGMAYEALNNAAKLETNFIIILNDNNMSISESIGGMSKYLGHIRTMDGYLNLKADVYKQLSGQTRVIEKIRHVKNNFKQFFVPGMLFENLGITYLGPIDGHNEALLEHELQEAKKVKKAVILHVLTKKGKGYEPAEKHPSRFHGAEPFNIENGIPAHHRKVAAYQDIFSTVMWKLGERDPRVCAITAAMADGTGLKRFRNKFPDRFFDVGISEEHAVTFAAGLAEGGMRPVFAVYSTFLQRAYDQIIEDVCLQNLPVVLAIDRAGLVGSDGETHQGIFDLSYLSSMPNMHIMAPKNKWELSDMLKFAVNFDGPIAIRYPRGEAYAGLVDWRAPIEMGKAEPIFEEGGVLLLAVGSMVKTAVMVREILAAQGIACSLTNARFVKPIDEEYILSVADKHPLIVTMEENVLSGGFGEKVRSLLGEKGCNTKIMNIGIPDQFVTHGSPDTLMAMLGIDEKSIAQKIKAELDRMEDKR